MDPRTEKLLADRERRTAAIPPALRGSVRTLDEVRRWVTVNRSVARVGAAAAAVLLFAAYYVFVALPAQRADQRQIETRAADRLRTQVAERQIAADDCLSKAQADAETRWTAACKAHRDRAGCALPERQTEDLQRQEAQARNACLMKFSITAQ